MNQQYLERKIHRSRPLVELMDQFPDAGRLHSPLAREIYPLHPQWNGHTLKTLITEVDEALRDQTFVFTPSLEGLYNRIKKVYTRVKEAMDQEIHLRADRFWLYQQEVKNLELGFNTLSVNKE